jgi:hypothetical protein
VGGGAGMGVSWTCGCGVCPGVRSNIPAVVVGAEVPITPHVDTGNSHNVLSAAFCGQGLRLGGCASAF